MTNTSTATAAEIGQPAFVYEDLPRLMSLLTGDEKHSLSAMSALDVLWVLYDRVLQVAPDSNDASDRDRFLMSKGHGPMAYYAVLASKGFIATDILPSFGEFLSPLGMHPDGSLIPGVEIASGSLGHGLPIAVGMGLGLRAQGNTGPKVVCLVGDGELDEGSNHEAVALAARHSLENLIAVVVDNRTSSYGWPGGVDKRFAVEGWSTAVSDGHDHDALEAAFNQPHPGRPHVVVAVTQPGR